MYTSSDNHTSRGLLTITISPPPPHPGQSTKACELFLKNRAAAVQTAIRQLRIEGATLLYIHKLCNIFFTSLLETAKEFEMDFAGNTGCYSAFVVWSRSAMQMFVSAFSKQVARAAEEKEEKKKMECVCSVVLV